MLSFRPTAARRIAPRSTAAQPGVMIVSLACLCTPLATHAAGPLPSQPSAVEVRSELVANPGDRTAGSNTYTAPQAAQLSGSVRSTVWARRGAASIGLGVQAPMGTVGNRVAGSASGDRANLASPSLLVGVAVDTSPRSRLVLDTPLPYGSNGNSTVDNSLNPADAGREVRVGLVIKPADPLRNLRAGQLFKVELSGRSQVALRPRSGGVAVSYTSRF